MTKLSDEQMAEYLDKLSRKLIEGKRDAERRVQEAHRDGNQITYGGYRRYDAD